MPGSCCDILCNVNKSHLAGVRPEHLAKCAYIFSLIDSSVNQPRKHDSVIVHSRAVEKLYDCLTRKSLFKCPLAGAPGGNSQWCMYWQRCEIRTSFKPADNIAASLTVHLQKELLSSFVPSMVPSGSIWR